MNRSAPRGPLQSGCLAAWARGFHRLPSRSGRFRKAGFVIAFFLSNRDIISRLRDLSRRLSLFFSLLSPFYHDTLYGADTLAAAAAGDRSALMVVDPIPETARTAQYQSQYDPSRPCHSGSPPVFFSILPRKGPFSQWHPQQNGFSINIRLQNAWAARRNTAECRERTGRYGDAERGGQTGIAPALRA